METTTRKPTLAEFKAMSREDRFDVMDKRKTEQETLAARLEYLRGELRAERISYEELSELQSLAAHIDPGDVELLEAAGVEEFGEGREQQARDFQAQRAHAELLSLAKSLSFDPYALTPDQWASEARTALALVDGGDGLGDS